MFNRVSPLHRTVLSLPMVCAAVVVVMAVTGPASASAAITPRSTSGGSVLARRVFQAAQTLTTRSSGAPDSRALSAHSSILPCAFNGASNLVPNVTPGETLTVSCTGFAANEEVVIGQSSPLTLAVD